jgi:hypothetical protein
LLYHKKLDWHCSMAFWGHYSGSKYWPCCGLNLKRRIDASNQERDMVEYTDSFLQKYSHVVVKDNAKLIQKVRFGLLTDCQFLLWKFITCKKKLIAGGLTRAQR